MHFGLMWDGSLVWTLVWASEAETVQSRVTYCLIIQGPGKNRRRMESWSLWERKRFQPQAESCMVGFSGSKAFGFGSLKSCLCGSDSQQVLDTPPLPSGFGS